MAAAGRRGADGKLGSAQAALLLQEETLRRGERERRALLEKVSALERSLHAAEGERRSAQVGTWVKTPTSPTPTPQLHAAWHARCTQPPGTPLASLRTSFHARCWHTN